MRTTTTLPSVDDLRRRFRAATNRRALQELASDTARALRQVDEAMGDGGDSDGDETLAGLFAALRSLMDEIQAKVDRQALLDDLATRQAPPRDRADARFEMSKYRFELRGMILRQLGHEVPGLDLGPSVEISSEIRRRSPRAFRGIAVPVEALHLTADYFARGHRETRADTISSGLPAAGPGSNLVQTVLDASMYVDALRSRSVIRQAGATVMSGMIGNYDIPKMSQTTQVSWFSEGSSIARPEPEQFSRVQFRVKHCGAIIAYSIEILLNSTPSVEMLIRDDLSKLLSLDMDRVALVGSGQNSEPLGVIYTPGVGTVAAGAFAYDSMVDIRQQITGKNADLGTLCWFGNSVIDAYSMKAVDAMSRPLGKDLVFLGLPFYTSNIVTAPGLPAGAPVLPASANPLILASASQIFLSFWRELDVQANGLVQSAWDSGGVEIRAILDADVQFRHIESASWQDVTAPPLLPPFIAPSGAGTGGTAAHATRNARA